MVLTTLAHHIDIVWMWQAYKATRKSGASGVDGVTAEEYEKDLEGNLERLLERFKTGTYKAPPVRRVHIPKGDGKKTRPIGIPTLEDKVLQRAVSMVLEAVYEQDFLDCSYGFRPGRSPHQVLERLWKLQMDLGGGWVLDADIKGFFDNMSHCHLRGFLDRRVRDGVIRRTIDKWLKAGVLEDGTLTRATDKGTPQGGVVSPILANVYLHEAIDKWYEQEVRPRLRAESYMLRFADDVLLVFASEQDAREVWELLGERLASYGLTLSPEKTRLVDFRRPSWKPGEQRPARRERPGTFDFLGFTHSWGKSRRGRWTVRRKTARGRMKRAVAEVREWCKRNRHEKVADQHRSLSSKLKGHCAYYGITGNSQALDQFRTLMERLWRYWLNRRSQRARMTWRRFELLKRRYPLPKARAIHSVYCR